MHSDTYRLSTGTFYKTRRLLQGISEQKLQAPQFPGSAVFVLKAASNVNMY